MFRAFFRRLCTQSFRYEGYLQLQENGTIQVRVVQGDYSLELECDPEDIPEEIKPKLEAFPVTVVEDRSLFGEREFRLEK